MHLISQKYHREMADIKSLNYAFAIRHWAEVKNRGGNDLLYYTDELGVSESSRSNLFFVKSGIIYTPGQQILEGITRNHILSLASKEFEVRVGDYSIDDFCRPTKYLRPEVQNEFCPFSPSMGNK